MKIEIQDKKGLAFFFGLAIIMISIIFKSNPILISNPDQAVIMLLVNIGIRILAFILCANIAEDLNRSPFGWGIFAFLSPVLILIVITFVRTKKGKIIEVEDLNLIDEESLIDNIDKSSYEIYTSSELKEENNEGKMHLIIDGYLSRANSNFIQQKYTEAISDFSTILVLNPTNAEVYYLRGLSEIAIGLNDSAFSDLNKSKKLGFEKADDTIKKYFLNR